MKQKLFNVLLSLIVAIAALTSKAATSSILRHRSEDERTDNSVITQDRLLPVFTQIHSAGPVNIVLENNKSNIIKVSGESSSILHVKTYIKGSDILCVELDDGFCAQNNNEQLIVSIPIGSVHQIRQKGSGNISCRQDIKKESLTVTNSGSGNCVLEGQIQNLQLFSMGSGDISFKGQAVKCNFNLRGSANMTLEGTAEALTIKNFGSGEVNAGKFVVNVMHIKNQGSGNGIVQVQDIMTLNSSGSGSLSVIGKASEVSIHKSGSGFVDASKLMAQFVVFNGIGSGKTCLHATLSLEIQNKNSEEIYITGAPLYQNVFNSGNGEIHTGVIDRNQIAKN